MTADKAGNKGVDVLSTPMLLQLIEEAAVACLAPALTGDQISLGSYVDLTHIAPSPVGFIVRTEVEVIGVERAADQFRICRIRRTRENRRRHPRTLHNGQSEVSRHARRQTELKR